MTEWQAALDELEQRRGDNVPPGWLTLAQLSEAMGRPARGLERRVREGEQQGIFLRKQFRIISRDGRPHATNYYTLASKTTKGTLAKTLARKRPAA